MRWLVTGSTGMLGTDVAERLRSAGEEVTAATRRSLDLSDVAAVKAAVAAHDVVVNCVAWTAVDDAEDHEDEARVANAEIPARLADAAAQSGARLVHLSTDYVFDGTATTPYAEDASLSPASAYGRTKAEGEQAVRDRSPDAYVVRTAWLYGAHGGCFPKTVHRILRERGEISVVDDQVGQPTWTADVADLIVRLVATGPAGGVYHATAGGQTTWFDFAREIAASAGLDPSAVKPTTSEAFKRPAPRPAFSVLGHDALDAAGVTPIGHWHERWAAAADALLT